MVPERADGLAVVGVQEAMRQSDDGPENEGDVGVAGVCEKQTGHGVAHGGAEESRYDGYCRVEGVRGRAAVERGEGEDGDNGG